MMTTTTIQHLPILKTTQNITCIHILQNCRDNRWRHTNEIAGFVTTESCKKKSAHKPQIWDTILPIFSWAHAIPSTLKLH
jgi:hypothetical protein